MKKPAKTALFVTLALALVGAGVAAFFTFGHPFEVDCTQGRPCGEACISAAKTCYEAGHQGWDLCQAASEKLHQMLGSSHPSAEHLNEMTSMCHTEIAESPELTSQWGCFVDADVTDPSSFDRCKGLLDDARNSIRELTLLQDENVKLAQGIEAMQNCVEAHPGATETELRNLCAVQ